MEKIMTMEERQQEALRREKLVHCFQALKDEGLSLKDASRRMDIAPSTIWKWNDKYSRYGLQGLIPKISGGRPSKPVDPDIEEAKELVFIRILENAIRQFKKIRPESRPRLKERADELLRGYETDLGQFLGGQ